MKSYLVLSAYSDTFIPNGALHLYFLMLGSDQLVTVRFPGSDWP